MRRGSGREKWRGGGENGEVERVGGGSGGEWNGRVVLVN